MQNVVSAVWLAIILCTALRCECSRECTYKKCNRYDEDALNVHMVPHSHCDAGWVKTFDEYYSEDVSKILTSVVIALARNPQRKFVWAEMSYFFVWYSNMPVMVRNQIAILIKNGQFEFVGGGWVQNDEATTNYQSIIDQMGLGIRRIRETFGKCAEPNVGWQLDPFGHSREMASIFAQLQFDGLYLGRIDYQDKEQRIEDQQMQLVWQGDPDLGNSSKIFTTILYNTYFPPEGFCFDRWCSYFIDSSNARRKSAQFIRALENIAAAYATNHILIPMGGDFTYSDAERYFQNMDYLIKYITKNKLQLKDGRPVNIFYSSPACYQEAVFQVAQKQNLTFITKTDDFFPYADKPHQYWTGYFTSHPEFKRYVEDTNHLLQVGWQLSVINGDEVILKEEGDLHVLVRVLGEMQHHDAITGTSKQRVVGDYLNLLYTGRSMVFAENQRRLSKLIGFDIKDQMKIKIQNCPLINITECEISRTMPDFLVGIYNPLGWYVDRYISIPVSSPLYGVFHKDDTVPVQITPSVDRFTKEGEEVYDLVFLAKKLPPLGMKFYRVRKQSFDRGNTAMKVVKQKEFGNEELQIIVDENGFLTHAIKGNVSMNMRQYLEYYRPHLGEEPFSHGSGAYLFRAKDKMPYHFLAPETTMYTGKLYDEIRQKFNNWTTQILRVYKNAVKPYIEYDWIIGPINLKDFPEGVEIITRFKTQISNDGEFSVDSNGKNYISHKTDDDDDMDTIARNYYPVTNRISISDKIRNTYFTVITDRAQGGSSQNNGEVELMLHRALTKDDGLGVEEPLIRTTVTRGQYVLDFGNRNSDYSRKIALDLHLPHMLYFIQTSQTSSKSLQVMTKYQSSALKKQLPDSIHLLTLSPWTDEVHRGNVLIRLEHIKINNNAVSIDFNTMFTKIKIEHMMETDLSGLISRKRYLADNLVVTLLPSEIKTFVMTVIYL